MRGSIWRVFVYVSHAVVTVVTILTVVTLITLVTVVTVVTVVGFVMCSSADAGNRRQHYSWFPVVLYEGVL